MRDEPSHDCLMNNRTKEELGAPDLKVGGFELWVDGRQFPESADSYDGNWLRVRAHVSASGASVWVSGAILMVADLKKLGRDVEALARGEKQQAALEPLEPELKLQFEKLDSLGHFTMRVHITPDHLTQKHYFEFEIDQTYLHIVAAECQAIAKAYPAR